MDVALGALLGVIVMLAGLLVWSLIHSARHVRHLEELLASRSYAEYAQGQKILARAKSNEPNTPRVDAYTQYLRNEDSAS